MFDKKNLGLRILSIRTEKNYSARISKRYKFKESCYQHD